MIFYNDNDRYVAQWLGNIVAAGHLPQGTVDARGIGEIAPRELRSFRQCHFFAGIGGWPYALALAGWPSDRDVWTASCPCQPLSSAGQRRGHADERHLWPALYRLIAECRPATIFGEQVASKDGREWLSGVRADLEAIGYAVGAADLCAAGAGAPHIRQRLFWVADATGEGRQPIRGWCGEPEQAPERLDARGATGGLGDANSRGQPRLADARLHIREDRDAEPIRDTDGSRANGFWSDAEWLPCLDGKSRRVEPGTFPLAHGVSARVGRLRAYGNAIVPQVAAEFVKCYLEAIE
jgi:DNA (cytosine-5)-methyltransferase 1